MSTSFLLFPSCASTKGTAMMFLELLIRVVSRVTPSVVSVVKDSMETMSYTLTAVTATKGVIFAIVDPQTGNNNTILTTMH
jgi:hypothetical protein